jgi:hypothetical protein
MPGYRTGMNFRLKPHRASAAQRNSGAVPASLRACDVLPCTTVAGNCSVYDYHSALPL